MKLLASLIFFTRLPFWRITEVPARYYSRVVDLWSATGWLTGSITAGSLWLAWHVFPPLTAVIAAISVRLLVTGALHEDGLADFMDGMGGGTTKERILAIMKDSHIGTYGVIGLTIYFMLLVTAVSSLPMKAACIAILAADPWSKFCASQIINLLPYSRTREEAKNKTVYDRMKPGQWTVSFLFGALPLLLLPVSCLWATLFPVITASLLIMFMRNKIDGYTGDCCGAVFLLSELSFLLAVTAIYRLA
ncbi:MAG: adenosylcobinamide-GDP ribazoletransferase [Duncaniella sp.]|nr:adenosylcobinamide-GDP ribazoletransferase [Duncaniella sp.]